MDINGILTTISNAMGTLKIPTLLGQGILSVVEFFLVGGNFFVELFKNLFSIGA